MSWGGKKTGNCQSFSRNMSRPASISNSASHQTACGCNTVNAFRAATTEKKMGKLKFIPDF